MKKNDREQPNVIVFFTDQQRWDTTGVHGNPLVLTPTFDRMAREGTHLYHTFTCQPVFRPGPFLSSDRDARHDNRLL